MPCPLCKGPTRVYSTEHRPEGTARRRICTSSRCAHKFLTLEKRALKISAFAWPQ